MGFQFFFVSRSSVLQCKINNSINLQKWFPTVDMWLERSHFIKKHHFYVYSLCGFHVFENIQKRMQKALRVDKTYKKSSFFHVFCSNCIFQVTPKASILDHFEKGSRIVTGKKNDYYWVTKRREKMNLEWTEGLSNTKNIEKRSIISDNLTSRWTYFLTPPCVQLFHMLSFP